MKEMKISYNLVSFPVGIIFKGISISFAYVIIYLSIVIAKCNYSGLVAFLNFYLAEHCFVFLYIF
jgi:hypothetical protein